VHSHYTHRSNALPEGHLEGLPFLSLTTKGSWIHLWGRVAKPLVSSLTPVPQVWWYVRSFRYNTRVWQTDRWMDGFIVTTVHSAYIAWWHVIKSAYSHPTYSKQIIDFILNVEFCRQVQLYYFCLSSVSHAFATM